MARAIKRRKPKSVLLQSWLSLAMIILSCHLWRTTAFVNLSNNHHNHNHNHNHNKLTSTTAVHSTALSSEEIRSRLIRQLEKLREKDRQSKVLKGEVRTYVYVPIPVWILSSISVSSVANPSIHLSFYPFHNQDLKVVYEDKYLVVVDKPSGVLCVPTEEGIPSLAQTVFESVSHKSSSYDRMVVHRLGMDTSGLVIFAKTMDALRGMNTLFRTRQVTRQYEVLVCGHVLLEMGTIDMPLMRDYVFPPYMRVSTDAHQQALVDLDPLIVGKKLLEAPKPSQTKYEVVRREQLHSSLLLEKEERTMDLDLPVTRMTLTSITGRTHQLNVHCAAFGHPIVGDRVYGLDGEAAPHGGLLLSLDDDDSGSSTFEEENAGRASIELQRKIANVAKEKDMDMCVHAKRVFFRHPVTGKVMNFESPATF
jgi:23S rRNA-/tRNA-specific pseudouridylate synthase